MMALDSNQKPAENGGEEYLLSLEEAAYRLSISRTTLWRLTRTGEIETVRIGSRSLISKRSIENFISRNSSAPFDPRG